MARRRLNFLGLITKCSRSVTQSPRHIIKHTNLLSLRIDDSLATSRLIYIYIIIWCWLLTCGGLNKMGFVVRRGRTLELKLARIKKITSC